MSNQDPAVISISKLTLFKGFYILASLFFTLSYVFDNTSGISKTVFMAIYYPLMILLFAGSIYFLAKDYRTNEHNFTTNRFFPVLVAFFAYCIISTFVNGNAFVFYNNWMFPVHSALFLFLCMISEGSEEQDLHSWNQVGYLFIFLIDFLVLGSLATYILRRSFLYDSLSFDMQAFLNVSAGPGRRLYGIVGNANSLAYSILYCIFLVPPLMFFSRNKADKGFLISTVVLSVYCAILAGARGALLIGIVCALALACFVFQQIKKDDTKRRQFFLILGIFVFVCILILLFFFLSQSSVAVKSREYFFHRILRLGNIKTGDDRLDLWRISTQMLTPRNIWFGISDTRLYQHFLSIGSDLAYYLVNNEGRLHNYYLIVLVTFGLPAFIMFVALIGATFRSWFLQRKDFSKQQEIFLALLMIQFFAIVLSGFLEQLMLNTGTAVSLPTCFVWGTLFSFFGRTESKSLSNKGIFTTLFLMSGKTRGIHEENCFDFE
ncbi:MAG: O-antigen ligase family protein [Spirochaetia bacterium]|jgi:O-antigen ligase|nr:O-antigen ligase family protein [Spirochaetia bacterium]